MCLFVLPSLSLSGMTDVTVALLFQFHCDILLDLKLCEALTMLLSLVG